MAATRLRFLALPSLFVLLAFALTAPAVRGGERYVNEEYGFSIVFPDGWVIQEKNGTEARVLAIYMMQGGGFPLTSVVGTADLPDNVSLDDWALVLSIGLGAQYEEYKLHDQGETRLNGLPARWIICSFREQEFDLKAVFYIAMVEKRAYMILGMTDKAQFDRHLPTFRQIAESFRLEGETGVPSATTPTFQLQPGEDQSLPTETRSTADPSRQELEIRVRPGEEQPPSTVSPTQAPRRVEIGFSVALEQHGRPVEIRDHQAILDKAPFTILLYLRQSGVLVNLSPTPATFNACAEGRPLGSMPWYNGEGYMEGFGNQARAALVAEDNYQFWFFNSLHSHRFDEVAFSGDLTVCRRTIAQFQTAPGGKASPIEAYPGGALYIAVFDTGLPSRFYDVPSYHAEWIKVRFR